MSRRKKNQSVCVVPESKCTAETFGSDQKTKYEKQKPKPKKHIVCPIALDLNDAVISDFTFSILKFKSFEILYDRHLNVCERDRPE